MSAKSRFDSIMYVESLVISVEDIGDEVDRNTTFAVFHREESAAGKSGTAIKAEWLQIVEDNKSECFWRRGQWLIPEFMGTERRKRRRVAEEIKIDRLCDVKTKEMLSELFNKVPGEAQVIRRHLSAGHRSTVDAGAAGP